GQCFVSEETIARALGTDARQVRRCMKQLREDGWIHVERRFNQSSVYCFAWGRAVAHEQVEPARKTEASTPCREFGEHLEAVETVGRQSSMTNYQWCRRRRCSPHSSTGQNDDDS